MEKPHRFLIDRVADIADEASAFLRRRRISRRPFARVHLDDDRIIALDAESTEGQDLFLAASALIEAAEVEPEQDSRAATG